MKFSHFTSVDSLQKFLDEARYNPEEGRYRCPRSVLRERVAHCFEGAVFAAAVLRQLGYEPLIVNMFPEPGTDDEHLVAVYRRKGHWGAVAKSNVVGLRSREPIHRTVRELMISYFEQYYNLEKMKTLRTYTRPLNLSTYDKQDWVTRDETMIAIDKKLDALKRIPLLTRPMIASLSLVDERSYAAGLLGSDPEGLFRGNKT